jgi:hypothetical protein
MEPLRKAPLVFDSDSHPEQKPYVELWRVQNEQGEGPYRGFDEPYQKAWADPNHDEKAPLPRQDPGFHPEEPDKINFHHKFGFETMDHLNKWFSPAELTRLSSHGYKPTKVKAKKVYSSGNQAFYEPYEEPEQPEKLAASEKLWKAEHMGLCCMFLFDGVNHPDILHVTHHYFRTIKDPKVIIKVLEKYFKTHPLHDFTPSFKNEDFFGDDKDVRVLRPPNQQKRMFLLDLKDQLDKLEKDKFREYKPHVSVSSNVDKVNFPIINYALVQSGKILWTANEKLAAAERPLVGRSISPNPIGNTPNAIHSNGNQRSVQAQVVPDWRSSYAMHAPQQKIEPAPKHVFHKEMGLFTENLPEEQLKSKMLNDGKLIYSPGKGFLLNRRMTNTGKNEPLMRNELPPTTLVHYSKVPGLKEIRTDKMGTGAPSAEYKRGLPEIPRAYYYRAGTEPEDLVTQGAKSKYTTTLQPYQKIYDLGKDTHGLVKQALDANQGAWNADKILGHIKSSGFHGYSNSSSALPNVVALFHHTPIDKEEML